MINVLIFINMLNKKISCHEIVLIEHKNERGAAAEEITDKVIAAQSLQVDTISGATSSSKVVLKAIENALNSQVKV